MSHAADRLSRLRWDLHNLKTTIRTNAHPDGPEWYIEQVESILKRDQDRIGKPRQEWR